MNWRRLVVAVTVALVLTTVASSVHAGEDSGTETLAFMEHVAVEIDGTDGSTQVTWDIEVTDGVPVNVLFMPEEGYEEYVDPMEYEFSYYPDHSKNNTMEFRKTVTVNEGIVYYLVIENVGYSSMDISTVEYDVTWDVAGGSLESWCWPLMIIILAILGGTGYWVWRRRQGSGTLTPPSQASGPGDEGPMEAPAAGTGTVYPPGRGTYHPPVEGQTELSPQPEPPDTPTDDPGYTGSGEPPAPGTGTVPATPESSMDGTILLDPESSRPHLPSVSEGPAPGTGVHHPPGDG
ncbi:MAG: hypothetical protein GQ558_08870, partial [Thermoplasmata archaeon]|nr:hypothetical protein [Thermoplasmata archaeon]